MFRKLFLKLFDKFIPAPPEVEEESPPDGNVSFCNPFSAEDIYNQSVTLTDFLNKIEKK